MFILTIVVGFIALIALAMPDLVLISLMLIVPGIVLMIAPTAFVYLATATAIRSVLPNATSVKTTLAALAGSGVLGCVVAMPFQLIGERAYRASLQDDVVGLKPLELFGHVRLERSDISHWSRGQENSCDELCAALLLTPGVKSVTLAKGTFMEATSTWQLVPRGSVPHTGLAPTNPGDIFHHYPAEGNRRVNGESSYSLNQARRQRLAAEWNLRLATSETLLRSDTAPEPDMTIVITHTRDMSEPRVQRVEVTDKAGSTLFRRSLVKHAVISKPLYIAFHASMSGSSFTVGRTTHSTGTRYESFKPVTELIENISGLCQIPSKDAPQQVKQQLLVALGNSDESVHGLDLAAAWLAGLDSSSLSDEDAALAERIVADLRIDNVGDALRHAYPKKVPSVYRSILVERIIASQTNATDRSYFASLLAKMPAGTFADMTEREWQIINDPALRMDAVAFIERLADLGEPGVEPLLEILQHAITTMPHWHMRRATIHALCRGFSRLGTEASGALPRIQSLFQQERSPITNNSSDALAWRVAMARMGLPIGELPYPASWKAQTIAKMRENVSRHLADFDPDHE